MALRHYTNAPATTLAAPCSAVATNITVTSASAFPAQTPYILILDRGEAEEEVVLVTNASGDTLTVTRGYDSTAAFAHSEGATVEHGISAIDPREANEHVNSENGVHGVSGDVVGTSDVQTLTNKDLSSGTNSFPSSLVTLTGSQTLTNKTFDSTSPTAFLPPGVIQMFAGNSGSVPTGWLLCDGSAVSRTTYANLFAVIGTTFGAGNGSTTFNLPNFNNRFPYGSNVSNPGGTGGASTVTLTENELPEHRHAAGDASAQLITSTDGDHVHGLDWVGTDSGNGGSIVRGLGVDGTFSTPVNSSGSHGHTVIGDTAAAGGGEPFSILPPYLRIHFIIKT